MARYMPNQYDQLLDGLQRAQRASISDWTEFVLPHAPPATEGWPAPDVSKFDPDSEGTLLRRLPPRQAVVCGLTGVEIVLPCWTLWTQRDNTPDNLAHGPTAAIELIWRWLHAGMDLAEVQRAIQSITRVKQYVEQARQADRADPRVRLASYVVRSVESILTAAFECFVAETYEKPERIRSAYRGAESAVFFVISVHTQAYLAGLGADAAPLSDVVEALHLKQAEVAPRGGEIASRASAYGDDDGAGDDPVERIWRPIANAVFVRWWDRCRCRLAFRDATSAELV